MSAQPIIIPAKRRIRRKRRRIAAAPPAVNQIVRVTHGAETDQLIVALSQPLTSYDDFDKMLAASATGELWIFPYNINVEDPLNLLFFMSNDVSECQLWRVPGPGNYHFGDGQELAEPFTGEIS